MKKYVFFTCDIHPIGGAQTYTLNKLVHEEALGYKVYVFFQGLRMGDFAISRFGEFAGGGSLLFYYPPSVYSFGTIKAMSEYMAKTIDYEEGDDIVIESHSCEMSLWAELLAKKCLGKHLVYLIGEIWDRDRRNYGMDLSFWKFKLSRGEMAGGTTRSLHDFFMDFMDVGISDEYFLLPEEAKAIQDVDWDSEVKEDDYDYVITYLGRYKQYTDEIISELVFFSKENMDKRIAIIFVGDVGEEKYSELEKMENVSIISTGVMYPIPRKILDCSNAIIAGAGSALEVDRCGYNVIIPDARDGHCNGILHIDTENRHYEDRETHPAVLYRESIYKQIKLGKIKRICDAVNSDAELKRHDEFIKKSEKKKDYYDVLDVKFLLGAKEKKRIMKYNIAGIIGIGLFHKFIEIKEWRNAYD